MASRERAGATAERFAKNTQDSYQRDLEHMVALQERNTRFAHDMLDSIYTAYPQQYAPNRHVALEILGRVEQQYVASMELLNASLYSYRDRLKATR